MSLQEIVNPEPAPPQTFDAMLKETKIPLRSWRKKYRKMKLRFDKVMEESNNLFRDCHKMDSLAKRLQEENDQLLDILLDLNESNHVPSYDLGRPNEDVSPVPSASAVPGLEPDVPRSLATLLTIPHTHVSSTTKFPAEMTGDHLPGYFNTAYEEEYLNNLDAQLATDDALEDVHQQLRLPPSRILPSEKELQNQNPQSVLSWLRRHHPETFIQEKEAASEKSAPRPRGGGGKRSSLAQATNANPAPSVSASTPGPKTEHDTADEEQPTAENGGSEKGSGKRGKQKDDEPYRPKGGSSRPPKRKREDGETPKGGRGKRAKGTTSTPS